MSRVRVKVQQGVLEGQVLKTMTGFPYKSFTGIPYAKPPVGDLRFRDPVPADNWKGVFDATIKVKECLQFDYFIRKQVCGVEDAVQLNVYAPDGAKEGDKLPVMFWIHGGGFNMGNGGLELYGPGHLVPHNVILVTINYRLGPLGFLCLDIEEAPGNMGLKDQVLALKWVNKNIETFGGDASNVTIFGESAGGSSVHYLIMSPLTKGLIKQAIIQSGTAVCEWSVPFDRMNGAFKLGEALGLKTNNKHELIKFLKEIPADKLMAAAVISKMIHLEFGPVVEKKISNVTPFCTKDPRKMIEDGDFTSVPAIIGCTTNEGFTFSIADNLAASNGSLILKALIPDFKEYVPIHLLKKFDAKKIETAAQKIEEKYFPNEDNGLDKLQDFQSDFAFVKDINFTIKNYAKKAPVYYYEFGVKAGLNLIQFMWSIPYKGASHADELGYLFTQQLEELFKTTNLEISITEKETLAIARMTVLWTNFAKYGNPTPEITEIIPTFWKPVTSGDELHCLEIGDDLVMKQDPYKERVQFWESLENL